MISAGLSVRWLHDMKCNWKLWKHNSANGQPIYICSHPECKVALEIGIGQETILDEQPPCGERRKKLDSLILPEIPLAGEKDTSVSGPGDHLHDILLAVFGAGPTRKCGCKDRIVKMNRWGVTGCRKNFDEIAGWLVGEVKKHRWTFARIPGPWLAALPTTEAVICWMIRKAIKRTERDEKKKVIVEQVDDEGPVDARVVFDFLGDTKPVVEAIQEKWMDVGTTAVPRMLTSACIGSFLSVCDSHGYKLRWIVHLDSYPRHGLNHLWGQNKVQIEALANSFDDAILMFSDNCRGYGESVHKVMSKTTNPVLWIEDDYLWLFPFRLEDLRLEETDFASFMVSGQSRAYFGSTCPSFWGRRAVDCLLQQYPKDHRISEVTIKRIIRSNGKSKSNEGGLWCGMGFNIPPLHVGSEAYKYFGVVPCSPSTSRRYAVRKRRRRRRKKKKNA